MLHTAVFIRKALLIHLLDCGPLRAGPSTGPCLVTTASCWHPTLVKVADDGLAHLLQLFLLIFIFLLLSQLVVLQPVDCLVALLNHFLLVILTNLVFYVVILHASLHVEGIGLQRILSSNLVPLEFILGLVLLSLLHHPLNLLFAQPTLVISDGDLVLLTCAFVCCRHIQNTVCINVKCHFDLRDAAWGRRDA
ncbi:hypothetical protein AGOR_G00198510 [Albula goreensis]|uniref:Uncharacterized protein n=1 Tax=Albula goreensis TaxID=1534307 RepID=A0A8T3CSY3_9TELE|nr:hypothetical protein AGOR_G00198510 [Albula goreensis]